MISNKSIRNENIILLKNQKSIMTDHEVTKALSDFFSNAIKTLGNPKFDPSDSVTNTVNDPTQKAVLNYCKHPSILKFKEICKSNSRFSFPHITLGDIYK